MPRPRPTVEKKCPGCKETKVVESFYKSEKYDGGYSSYCRACYRIKNAENRLKTVGKERSERQLQKEKEYRYVNRKEIAAKTRAHTLKLKTTRPVSYTHLTLPTKRIV